MRHEGLSQMSHHATWSVATAFADRQGAQRVPRASVAERSAHHRSSQLVALGPRRGIRLYELEELHVVVDHLLERRGAVVVKVRRGLSDAPKSGDVELLPVVQGGRAADESGQHGASRIGARPANLRPGGETAERQSCFMSHLAAPSWRVGSILAMARGARTSQRKSSLGDMRPKVCVTVGP